MTSAVKALARLRAGNQRFVSRAWQQDALGRSQRQFADSSAEQRPFAIILGCSDSRVPVEFIFDQDFGDLFVVRVAGNVVGPTQLGSIEFAATRFGARLILVLGHSSCGAVLATIEELRQPTPDLSKPLRSIIDRIRPSVEALGDIGVAADSQPFTDLAIRSNIRASVQHLRTRSTILKRLVRSEDLLVVGGEYSLDTGRVDFFDGVPDAG